MRTKVAYLGPAGTYTQQALKLKLPQCDDVPYPNIPEVFAAVAAGVTEMGFVPIENLIEGRIAQTLDNLLQYAGTLSIIDACVLPIEHALGALPGHGAIRHIISKDIALEQCSSYLRQTYPEAELKPEASTTAAMQRIINEKLQDTAAIGISAALREYGLEILAGNIANIPDNKTRFILIGRELGVSTGRDVTSLAIYPKRDRVRLLYDMLDVISVRHNLNMTDIDRRPDKKGLSVFFIDIEGHINDENVRSCIAEITANLSETNVAILGSYPYQPFNEPFIKTIGIIGGTGEMGSFFVPFFTERGYKVLVAGRNTELSYEECAQTCDALLINVPIEHSEAIIRRVGPLMRTGQLLIDNTGVKTAPVKTMLEAAAPGVEVLSIHTMFGPGVAGIMDQNVISIHTGRSGPMAQEFEDILFKHGARITRSTPEEHDRIVTLTQGLEHMDGVAKLTTILELVGDPDELEPFSTPNSRKSAETCSRIHEGDAHLYAVMLRENPYVLKTLETYMKNFGQMVAALKEGQTLNFEEHMNANAKRLKE